jgi:hypothetical protein
MHLSILRRAAFLAVLFVASATAWAGPAASEGAEALRAKQQAIQQRLDHNGFGRPLEIESWEKDNHLGGDVYGIVQFSFATVAGLQQPGAWCEVLILPFNTKHCAAAQEGATTRLKLRIGRKAEQAAQDAYPLEFTYRVAVASDDFMRVELQAPSGPFGTRDYRITLEATPLDGGRSFIHLSYTYGFAAMSRLAMQAYLSTVGANKVGFTVVGHDEQGQPQFVGGMLGATERNTMRYFLAIDAWLGSLAMPPQQRLTRRLESWFAASERYPRQLHEMDRAEYLALKQKEAKAVNAQL